ncbi:MAG: hypothetical protein VST66_05185, partial [Nitrospirota bacterium]|nr:hypothetical protein [Nitrospirota bacterium]
MRFPLYLKIGCFLGLVLLGPTAVGAFEDPPALSQVSKDLYYQTEGVPQGPAVPDVRSVYPRISYVDNRVLVWVVTQQHTYFGGFVLALPLFCVLLEFLGLFRRDHESAKRFDGLARDLLRVALIALSITAILGSVMLALFILLYPGFMGYMGATFKS